MTFIKNGLQYSKVEISIELECVVVIVWSEQGRIFIVNNYNPGLQLYEEILEGIMAKVEVPVIWTGDFNAYSAIWGSSTRDRNGSVPEDFIDNHGLVVLNDGRPTWFRTSSGSTSCTDLTFNSPELAILHIED